MDAGNGLIVFLTQCHFDSAHSERTPFRKKVLACENSGDSDGGGSAGISNDARIVRVPAASEFKETRGGGVIICQTIFLTNFRHRVA